ncbi:MAG: hypothetical protein CSA76_02740 [Spirochaetales bacterium]|nr:MAG: hypothetical protein CSA76_02740 [Spirochaetales bacterium]
MISLEQVRQLDIRVKKAVSALQTANAENASLKQRLAVLEAEIQELTKEAGNRKAEEERLEISLQGVLDVLDQVDDESASSSYISEETEEEAEEDSRPDPDEADSETAAADSGPEDAAQSGSTEAPETIDLDSTETIASEELDDSLEDEDKIQSEFDIF